jgi:fumarate reductase subunit D
MDPAMRRNDHRAHGHPSWWAFWLHRVSGLLLALFLPLHFLALGQALTAPAALDDVLRFADAPLVKMAEWGLVTLLALHLGGGVRLLLIEFGRASSLLKNWIAGGIGAAVAVGLAFALALFA